MRESSLREIATEYARDGDLKQANAALEKLKLANPAQLLLSLAEQDISSGKSSDDIRPVALLAKALGVQSPRLDDFLDPTATPTRQMPSPAPASATLAPTATRLPSTATPEPTQSPLPSATPTPQVPLVHATNAVNLRGGPGKAYPVVGQLQSGEEVDIIGRNESGDWWQLACPGESQAWVAGTVVDVKGPIDTVAVTQDIPTPPPSPTPGPPTATPAPAGPEFRVVSIRLWGVEENGGYFDGPSVHCGEKRQLRVIVLDAAGNRLNGVTVKAIYGNQEEIVTGSDGKGPGIAEFVLGGGQDVYVIRDVDGREVSSDYARGLTTDPSAIPTDTLMGAGFCSSESSCADFVSQYGCKGHYSWEVVYQRAY